MSGGISGVSRQPGRIPTISTSQNIFFQFRSSFSVNERELMARVASSSSVDASDNGPSCDLGDVSFDTNLTPNEKRDIRAWDRRLAREKVFSKYYYPDAWEAREMVTIQKFLSITTDPMASTTVSTLMKSKETIDAISSIFFPSDHSPKSVLLKRGPIILLNGEEERELLLFTHGLLLSRLELDSLINILFTLNSENPDLLNSNQLKERFDAVDADGSGTIEKKELRQMFMSLGVPVSDEAMENIIERFDVDGDHEISYSEFEKVMHELGPTNEDKSLLGRLSLFGRKVQEQINITTGDGKLDKAYLFKDIDYIESIGVSSSASTKHIASSAFKDLAFAVFPKGGGEEMIFICSKPEQRMAWIDALSTCLINSKRFGSNETETGSPGWQHKVVRASIFSLVVCNNIDGLRQQLRHPSTDDGIDDQDGDGKTALHYAVALDNIRCATMLLNAKANVNVLDNDGKTPMDIATQLQNNEMMDLIKGLGGEANASECLFKSAIQEREELKKEESNRKGSLLAGKAKKATGALSDAMHALRERGDRIEKLSHRTADLKSDAADYAANARALKEKQKKKAGRSFPW